MAWWTRWASLGLVLLLAAQGVGSLGVQEPQRLVVQGISSLPMDLGIALDQVDGELLRIDEALDFALVHAPYRALEGLLPGHVVPDQRIGLSIPPDDRAGAESHDPRQSQQWALDFLDMPSAWDLENGSHEVVVGVIDSGVDVNHRDLAGVPMDLRRDYVDGGTVTSDPHGHGTHVSGIIAAVRANHIGIAGMADVSLLQIRVLDEHGDGWCSDLASAIQAARFRGADVINVSIAGALTCTFTKTDILAPVRAESLVVVAAGNDWPDASECLDTDPAGHPEMMAVAAVGQSGNLASFSCRSPWVEIAAPGESILSTLPGDRYEAWSGTSMAAPHVAATAALMKSANPGLSPEQLRALLIDTADEPSLVWDAGYGFGVVDPVRAIEAAIEEKTVSETQD